MNSGTAEVGTAAILRVLEDWGMSGLSAEHIVGGAFDTTNTNSGAHGGVMVRLEKHWQKRLLHIYCRHHIYER